MTPRRTVLVVDDDPDVVASVSALFHQFQFQVFSAETPKQALRIVKQPTIPVDLLVTDVHMPDMNGIELARAVRSLRPATKVIYISGDSAAEGMTSNADKRSPFLLKPFTLRELEAMVQNVLTLPAEQEKLDPRALRCPKCSTTNIRSSSPHVYEWLAWPVMSPFRCRECRARFYRFRLIGATIGEE
jgi:DNA-binding NtrC family response regulator